MLQLVCLALRTGTHKLKHVQRLGRCDTPFRQENQRHIIPGPLEGLVNDERVKGAGMRAIGFVIHTIGGSEALTNALGKGQHASAPSHLQPTCITKLFQQQWDAIFKDQSPLPTREV